MLSPVTVLLHITVFGQERLREETHAPSVFQPGDQHAAFICPRNTWLPEHFVKLAICKRAWLSRKPDENIVPKKHDSEFTRVFFRLSSPAGLLLQQISAWRSKNSRKNELIIMLGVSKVQSCDMFLLHDAINTQQSHLVATDSQCSS